MNKKINACETTSNAQESEEYIRKIIQNTERKKKEKKRKQNRTTGERMLSNTKDRAIHEHEKRNDYVLYFFFF